MQKFTKLTGIAAPLAMTNVDTDMIIPKQFLKTIKRTGLGQFLFNDVRHMPDGTENPAFTLNRPPYRAAKILVTGANFGCGSSREHAPWALLDFGINCIIAPSFADIFYNNCCKNGLLPIALSQEQVDRLMKLAEQGGELTVDLDAQTILAGDAKFPFAVDGFRKHCLLRGLDDIDLTEQHEAEIAAYEKRRKSERPWL